MPDSLKTYLRQYFHIRPVVIEGEPEAQRLDFTVGVQTIRVGPEYCENKEHAEWFIDMIIHAMGAAFAGLCNAEMLDDEQAKKAGRRAPVGRAEF